MSAGIEFGDGAGRPAVYRNRRRMRARAKSLERREKEVADQPMLVITGYPPSAFRTEISLTRDPEQNAIKKKAFDDCYDAIKPVIENYVNNAGTITPDQMINIVKAMMTFVEKTDLKSGADKKDVVLSLIYRLIDDVPIFHQNKQILLVIPYSTIIDALIFAADGKLGVNVKGCLKKMMPCCFA